MKKVSKLTDLQPLRENPNRHTERGSSAMEESIRKCGYGDSMTVDKNGVVISGNQRLETLADLGMEDAIIVQSDGSRPIIHQRTDLDAESEQGKLLAVAMNRVAELNLDWDADVLRVIQDFIPATMWTAEELAKVFGAASSPESFAEVGEDIETDYKCPKCGYKWSGSADPSQSAASKKASHEALHSVKRAAGKSKAETSKNGKKKKKAAKKRQVV